MDSKNNNTTESNILNSAPSISAGPVARRPKPQNKRPPTRKPKKDFEEDDLWNEQTTSKNHNKSDSEDENEEPKNLEPTPSLRNKAVGGVQIVKKDFDFYDFQTSIKKSFFSPFVPMNAWTTTRP